MTIESHPPIDVTPDTGLAVIIAENHLSSTMAESLRATLEPLLVEARRLIGESANITVTSCDQVSAMELAKERQLAIMRIRVKWEKSCDESKSDAIKMQKGIIRIKGFGVDEMKAVESRLLECANFAKNVEAKRIAEMKAAREGLLRDLGTDPAIYSNLGEMPDAAFEKLLADTEAAALARIEAAKKAEADRIAAEKARAEEEARIRAENQRLKLESEQAAVAARMERDRLEALASDERKKAAIAAKEAADKAKAEREAIEAAGRKEREEAARIQKAKDEIAAAEFRKQSAERFRAEKELAEHKAGEAKRLREEEAAKKRAEKAPDNEKLLQYAHNLRDVTVPIAKSDDAKKIIERISGQINEMAEELEEAAR